MNMSFYLWAFTLLRSYLRAGKSGREKLPVEEMIFKIIPTSQTF